MAEVIYLKSDIPKVGKKGDRVVIDLEHEEPEMRLVCLRSLDLTLLQVIRKAAKEWEQGSTHEHNNHQ